MKTKPIILICLLLQLYSISNAQNNSDLMIKEHCDDLYDDVFMKESDYFSFDDMDDVIGPVFANTVNGDLDKMNLNPGGLCIFDEETGTSWCPENYWENRVMGYMPFRHFDEIAGGSHSVYDIVMEFYGKRFQYKRNNDDFENTTEAIEKKLQGSDYWGLSEIIAAQWDKECPNLTLYNRVLPYNQDFFAKGNLVVNPSGRLNEPSYADPITNDPEFTIKSGVEVKMTAGNEIDLLPGFETEDNARFETFIDPEICSNDMKSNYEGSELLLGEFEENALLKTDSFTQKQCRNANFILLTLWG